LHKKVAQFNRVKCKIFFNVFYAIKTIKKGEEKVTNMKKFLSSIFIFLVLACCGLFYGCGELYSGLTFNVSISYDKNGENVTQLDNGDYRVVTDSGVFEDHQDGSYTFYIQNNKPCSATLNCIFTNAPSDFNYGVTFSNSNEIVKVSEAGRYTNNGVQYTITANHEGTTTLTVNSSEGEKSAQITINVVKVATQINFVKNNLAIINALNSKLTLSDDNLYFDGSKTNISYSFYTLQEGSEDLTLLTNNQLLSGGLSFNTLNKTLTVVQNAISLKNLYVKVTYDNPFGEDLTATTQITFVNPIQDYEAFLGSTKLDVTPENKINPNDICNLIINIKDLNFVNLVLRVRSNGEKVNFNYIDTANLPVAFLPSNISTANIDYLLADGLTPATGGVNDYYKSATFANIYIKVIATTKTTENDKYIGGNYTLNFTCDYSDYTVDNYPISTPVVVRNDTYVKNFSVNKVSLDSVSILDDETCKTYPGQIFINSGENVLGSSFKIDVANPVSILAQNARFNLTMYGYNSSGNLEKITDVNQLFKIQYSIGTGSDLVNDIDNLSLTYEKGTTFYIKPNDTTKLNTGDVYYIVINSVLPSGEENVDKQAQATIKLSIVQGIGSFNKYDYTVYNYEVDEDTGSYKLDPETNKPIKQTTTKTDVGFNEDLSGAELINLDLDSGFNATVNLSYLPLDATIFNTIDGEKISNIVIKSSDEKIFKVSQDTENFNIFDIIPIGIGSGEVQITTLNLNAIYTIKVNVYRPISNFTVNLVSTNNSYGVGKYVLSSDKKNLSEAQVKINKTIGLNLSTLPLTASQYTMDYGVYLGEVKQENLVGNYSVDYKGNSSSPYYIISNDEFQFNCRDNSFVFIRPQSVGKTYFVVLKLTNLNGSFWERTIKLSSYVPVEQITATATKVDLFNPNTIAYSMKTGLDTDPTVFGLQILVNKDKTPATYDFNNYGKIVVIVNGVNENIITCSNGLLTCSNKNSVFSLISNTADEQGYYYFRLNPDYDYSSITSAIYISVQVEELDYVFSTTRSFRVVKAEGVNNLRTFDEEQVYFKQGLSQDKNIGVTLEKDSAYNKNLLVKVYDIITIGKNTYYSDANSQIVNATLTQTQEKTKYNLALSYINAGNSVIVIMPEDKLIYKADYDKWFGYEYKQISITADEFLSNRFYTKVDDNYVLEAEYDPEKTYYVRTSSITDVNSLWKGYLSFYVTVADGIKVPYQVASVADLKEIASNQESVTKRYVLTKDIALDTTTNWQPLANYFVANVTSSEDFAQGEFYTEANGTYTKQNVYSEGTTYYGYGFNGEFAGKYSYYNVKTNTNIDYYHKITNISYIGTVAEETRLGLFTTLYKDAVVTDINLSYTYFQPVANADVKFGGVSAVSYGNITNYEINFDNFKIKATTSASIGGLVGENYGTIKNENISSTGLTGAINVYVSSEENDISVGGMVGRNTGKVIGTFVISDKVVYTYNDSGFDSSLNVVVEKDPTVLNALTKTYVGGAVGYNNGQVKNVSIQGNVTNLNGNNVGGLVGFADYNELFNNTEVIDEKTITNYSISESYSIAKVKGNHNVGGAVGSASSETNKILIYNISAENYVLSSSSNRTFIEGNDYVAGLIGFAKNVNVQYSYVVSYYDCELLEDMTSEDKYYDISAVGSYVGGFIGLANNCEILNSSSALNVKGADKVGLFVGDNASSSAINVFAMGCVWANNNEVTNLGLSAGGYYYYITNVVKTKTTYIQDFYNNASKEDIAGVTPENGWAKSENINGGLPYLTISVNGENQVLYATTPITIYANVKDNSEDYLSYIKYDDNSLILFFNLDVLGSYQVEDIQLLNMLGLNDFAGLEVYAKTHKSARLNLTSSDSSIITILSDGTLKILKEGKVTIKISSKLNYQYSANINIVVKYGVTDVSVYNNVALTNNLNNLHIDIVKSRSQTLYVENSYVRDLKHENGANLKATNEVGIRFVINNDDTLKTILDAADGVQDDNISLTINDLIKINGQAWLYGEGDVFYVDISGGVNPIIKPLRAMNTPDVDLNISYTPFIKTAFNTLDSTVLLDKFAGEFSLNIKKGATGIIFENNIDTEIKISQLQTQTFTVTLFTDYELDEINDNITALNSTTGNLLTVVKSDVVRKYKDAANTVLESISITYTLNYKDKINAVEDDLIYNFYFSATSDTTIKTNLKFIILGQDKISQVYGTIYASLKDFPQEPEKNNIIYNANVGALSIEVYPYFSNYNRMKVYYKTTSTYPLMIIQLSYNITGENGEYLTDYSESGAITDINQVMYVEKSSGQDTYLLNNLGTYSYSKIYFLSLLVSSEVPDDTEYTVYVEFLNRQNDIIETFAYTFTTIAQPSVKFTFDEDLLGQDDKYYLPVCTDNQLDVKLVNFEGDIEWQITSADEFTQNEIDVLLPTLNENGKYILKTASYSSAEDANNLNIVDLIGREFKLTAIISDGDRQYSSYKNIVLTMFTVKDVEVQNTTKGYMTLPTSTTIPLQVSLDIAYDTHLDEESNNWYADWYKLYKDDTQNKLYKYLTACGYTIEEYFSNYFVQLSNAISKAKYDYKDKITVQSGVWFYNASDYTAGYLQTNKDYNNSVFGVELYNDYFAVYGLQIDRNSSLSMRINIAYTNSPGDDIKTVDAKGIPNVHNYNVSPNNSTYIPVFKINKDFILTFVYKSDLINAIPVSTAEEFINMKEGFDYRLVNDIELTNYQPIETDIKTFDGNNYNIYISSFAYDSNTEEDCNLGLFSKVCEDTILYNVKVCYTNRVNLVQDKMTPSNSPLSITLLNSQNVNFGGIACENEGTLTNCQVYGKISITLNIDVNAGTIANALNGGLVANNASTGYITNSKVKNFELNCYGLTGGFVGENNGKIVASYFDESTVNNLSSNDTAGFVYNNTSTGNIYESYVQGYRQSKDNDIRNTGLGVVSKGIIGGFVFSNQGNISDSYSNISLSSSKYIAGFVYEETESSNISRCYSISYKSSSDNSTVASPFAGANSANYTKITINGTLNNCYYLKAGTWSDNLTWASDSLNKKATSLSLDDFSTHTKFVNYDLSLVYNNQETYADDETHYSYVDGYTWVIIEGKPVIVSTLIDTISQRDYVGKSKNYSDSFTYFTDKKENGEPLNIYCKEVSLSQDKVKKSYYDNSINIDVNALTDEQLLFYTIKDATKNTLTYYFVARNDNEALTIVYSLANKEGEKDKVISAEYGENNKILDVRSSNGLDYIEDANYRANDTIEIDYDADSGLISNINYKILENASYYYGSNAFKKSHVVGARTNPQIIYDYESFVYYTANSDTAGNYYRVIKDIDFNYQFTPTAYIAFQGALQGNYMSFDNISISYSNSKRDEIDKNSTSFGLFSSIKTIDVSEAQNFNTVVSNLSVNIVEVLSNSHNFVGGLAGLINAENTKKIIINNVSILGANNEPAYIQGKNAVGGLAGIVLGNVIIKDITSSVNVNATKEMNNGDVTRILYSREGIKNESGSNINPISNVSYAGGVVGIFDCNLVQDDSTLKRYNANNITVNGEISVIGGIVGSAFGLIGPSTVVNYANTTVSASEKCYLKAICYAGGLVGENRGTLIGSSVTYGNLDNYSSVKVGVSSLITNSYFKALSSNSGIIAIGGLVGFNHNGTVSNCISTVNVRCKDANIAGGAVGRMVHGKLNNVIVSGSVVAKSIIGGLVGTVNNKSIISEVYNNMIGGDSSGKNIITNCISANNWLVTDYNYYLHQISIGNPVGGFIGLIAMDETNSSNNLVYEDGVNSGINYYVNTLYTSSNSTSPEKYLKVAYQSNTLDMVTSFDKAGLEILKDYRGNQVVYPYSTREMYYEDTLIGPRYSIKTSVNNSGVKVYELQSSTDINNINDLYKKISKYFVRDTINLNNQDYGKIYKLENGEFKAVTRTEDIDKDNTYCIPDYRLTYLETTKTYEADKTNSIVIEDSNYMTGTKLDSLTYTDISDISDLVLLYVNGIRIEIEPQYELTRIISQPSPFNVGDVAVLEFKPSGISYITALPNDSLISGFRLSIVKEQVVVEEIVTTCYRVSKIDIDYVYNIHNKENGEIKDEFVSQFIKTVESKSSNNVYNYNLSVASKAVIYKNFINNGYWLKGDNFFLNADYDNADKYLTNLEYADTYVWTSFKADDFYSVVQDGEKTTIYISSAEQLAKLADEINTGKDANGNAITYNNKNTTIKLINDIDLSGKYWMPIGATNSFKAVFDGLEEVKDNDGNVLSSTVHTIKYTSVNENSIGGESVFNAGLFGTLSNAVVKNLNLVGGDISGIQAGGLAGAIENNTVVENITNRNSVLGKIYIGGIVGVSVNSTINNCVNYGTLSTSNQLTDEVCIGGIIGYADKNTTTNIVNHGSINAVNNKTNYSSEFNKVMFNVGGLVGRAKSVIFTGINANYGNITTLTNAHELNLGGVIGAQSNYTGVTDITTGTIKNLKNYGNIDVSYNNIYSLGTGVVDYSMASIGGIIGQLQCSLEFCGNEGAINFTLNTTASSYIGIGGIFGTSVSNSKPEEQLSVVKSYNANNITASAINKKTRLSLGGLAGMIGVESNNALIENSYNSGDISTGSNSTNSVGGLVGVAFSKDKNSTATREFIFTYNQSTPEYQLTIDKSLNIGYANITSINTEINALGAIIGLKNGFVTLDNCYNYYLRDSAYSGNKLFKGYCEENSSAGSISYQIPDQETGCYSKLMVDLKNIDTYRESSWSFSGENQAWEQYYDTWYPSIKDNMSSSMWSEKTEDLTQEKGYYVVSNSEQLAYLSNKINSGELDSENITIKLTNFLDMSNRYWTPIGTDTYPFKGTFDGNGYVIRNITVDGSKYEEGTPSYGGLFGVVKDATITNFGLESVIITNVDYAGGVVCFATNSNISKVYTDCGCSSSHEDKPANFDLTRHAVVSAKYIAGGLVGVAKDCIPLDENGSKGGIYYSYNNVNVRLINDAGYVEGKSYVGGLVGTAQNTLIDSCYNNVLGTITTTKNLTSEEGINSSMVIAGYADNKCGVINVFNIADYITDGANNTYSCDELLYKLNIKEGVEEASFTTGQEPKYENLEVREEINNKNIWTLEYTLNAKDYPSIRGLGQEWKNTESEAVISVTESEKGQITDIIKGLYGDENILIHYYVSSSSQVQITDKIYYFVRTAEELAWISTNVNNGSLLTTNTEFILLEDIDLSGKYWTPIGISSIYPFQGTFNLNGHEIKGLTIDTDAVCYGGLFGYTNNARIVNGYVHKAFVKVKSDDAQTNVYVGTIVGKGYNTTIENMGITTTLAGFSNSGTFIGGVIGSLTGTQNYKVVNVRVDKDYDENNASKYVDISAYYHQVVEVVSENGEEIGTVKSNTNNIAGFSTGGNIYAGGVVGYISGYYMEEANNEYLVNSAINNCNVIAVTTSNASTAFAGGVVGYALEEVKLNNIQNKAYVKTYTYQYDIVGGVVGYMNNGSIQNAYFDGYVESCQDFNNHIISYIGGVVGYIEAEGFVKYCVNVGSINSNPNYYTNAVIGAILGYSTDRTLAEDDKCVFVKNNFEFNAVGYDSANTSQEVVDAKFTQNLSNINSTNEFDSILWKNQTLNTKMIYLAGCNDSFDAIKVDGVDTSVALTTKGTLLVDFSSIELRYGNGSYAVGDKIIFSVMTKNGYVLKEANLNSDTFNLATFVKTAFTDSELNDILDNAVVFYVSFVSANTNP